jgi:hypothetical protein
MQTLDQNLQDLVKRNLDRMPEARAKARNKDASSAASDRN